MDHAETYADIVWKQFRKNRSAYTALWALPPVVALAIFAPLVCSDLPLVFRENGQVLFPWFRALFNPDQAVDFVFNMALLGFVPWLVASLILNIRWKKQNISTFRRTVRALGHYLLLTAVLSSVFLLVPGLRPDNRYRARTFTVEEFRSRGSKQGLYVLIPYGPTQQDAANFKPPMFRKDPKNSRAANDTFPHLLGTDNTGRDVLARMVYGTRISITVGFVAVGLYLSIGCLIGALAGYFGGRTDMLISRVIEVVLLFPSFFLILTLVGLLGRSIYIIMVVIGVTSWPTIARLIRGEVLKQRASEYVTAALALGFSHSRIIFRHILPNSLSPALVAAPFGVAGAIITEAGLSLLGVGVEPPAPTWGMLLKLGSENYAYWWLVVIPSVAIFLVVTIFNLIGAGLRDAMDPRLRSTH